MKEVQCPLFLSQISAGFPSQGDDVIDTSLDLNTYLIKNQPATFFVRVAGDSMLKAGIHPGDLLVVDRSLAPKHNHVVIAVVDGALTVKRLYRQSNQVMLMPENDAYHPLIITEEMDCRIWGVVTSVIHALVP